MKITNKVKQINSFNIELSEEETKDLLYAIESIQNTNTKANFGKLYNALSSLYFMRRKL